jgi:transposase
MTNGWGERFGAATRVAGQLGVGPESLRKRVHHGGGRRRDADTGVTSEARERMKLLERENLELRRANKILKTAADFLGAKFDRRSAT